MPGHLTPFGDGGRAAARRFTPFGNGIDISSSMAPARTPTANVCRPRLAQTGESGRRGSGSPFYGRQVGSSSAGGVTTGDNRADEVATGPAVSKQRLREKGAS